MLSADTLEQTRELIMAALADWQPARTSDVAERAIFSTSSAPCVLSQDERQEAPISATSTRRKGSSKLNCSEDVFDHLRALRTIKGLASHLGKWLLYRYGDETYRVHLPGLVEVMIFELPDKPKQQRSLAKLENMVARRLINEREFFEMKTKDLFEAMGVSKSVYFRRYARHGEQLSNQLERLDIEALSHFYRAYNTQI